MGKEGGYEKSYTNKAVLSVLVYEEVTLKNRVDDSTAYSSTYLEGKGG